MKRLRCFIQSYIDQICVRILSCDFPERQLNDRWRHISYAKFQQTMLLPDDADKEKISATVENGVLLVTIPKLEPKVVPQANKIIEIK